MKVYLTYQELMGDITYILGIFSTMEKAIEEKEMSGLFGVQIDEYVVDDVPEV